MATYAQYLSAIKNALSGVSANKQALLQLYEAHEQLVALADKTQGYSNDAHMVSCLEGALQLVTRCRMLGPMHAFFTADELLQCMQVCLEDAKRMRQVLLLKSGQLQELSSDWQVELQLPPRQLQVIRQVKAAAQKAFPAHECTDQQQAQELHAALKEGLLLLNGHSFLISQTWHAEVAAMLHHADQLKLMLRHQQAQYLQFVAKGLLQLHQLEVNEFDRPAATTGGSSSSSPLFSRPMWGAFPPGDPSALGSGSLYAGTGGAAAVTVQRAASLPSQVQLQHLQQQQHIKQQQQQCQQPAGSSGSQLRSAQLVQHVQFSADSHAKGLQVPQGLPSGRQHLTSQQQKRRWSVGALVMAHTRSPLSSPRGSSTGTESSSPRTFLHSSRAEAVERKRPASTTAADDEFTAAGAECSLPGLPTPAAAAGAGARQDAAAIAGTAAAGGAAGEMDNVWDLASQLDDFFLPVAPLPPTPRASDACSTPRSRGWRLRSRETADHRRTSRKQQADSGLLSPASASSPAASPRVTKQAASVPPAIDVQQLHSQQLWSGGSPSTPLPLKAAVGQVLQHRLPPPVQQLCPEPQQQQQQKQQQQQHDVASAVDDPEEDDATDLERQASSGCSSLQDFLLSRSPSHTGEIAAGLPHFPCPTAPAAAAAAASGGSCSGGVLSSLPYHRSMSSSVPSTLQPWDEEEDGAVAVVVMHPNQEQQQQKKKRVTIEELEEFAGPHLAAVLTTVLLSQDSQAKAKNKSNSFRRRKLQTSSAGGADAHAASPKQGGAAAGAGCAMSTPEGALGCSAATAAAAAAESPRPYGGLVQRSCSSSSFSSTMQGFMLVGLESYLQEPADAGYSSACRSPSPAAAAAAAGGALWTTGSMSPGSASANHSHNSSGGSQAAGVWRFGHHRKRSSLSSGGLDFCSSAPTPGHHPHVDALAAGQGVQQQQQQQLGSNNPGAGSHAGSGAEYASSARCSSSSGSNGTILSLQGVFLDLHSCRAVGACLYVCPHVRCLRLEGCGLTDRSVCELVDAIKVGCHLEELHLGCNDIEDVGARSLAKLLKADAPIRLLDLSGNSIGDDGGICLAAALTSNTHLRQLHLHHNQLAQPAAQALTRALQRNKRLTAVTLLPSNADMPLQLGKLVQRMALGNKGVRAYIRRLLQPMR